MGVDKLVLMRVKEGYASETRLPGLGQHRNKF